MRSTRETRILINHTSTDFKTKTVEKLAEDTKGWLVIPKTNRVIHFEKALLHGVLPGTPFVQGRSITKGEKFWRVNFNVGWWTKPCGGEKTDSIEGSIHVTDKRTGLKKRFGHCVLLKKNAGMYFLDAWKKMKLSKPDKHEKNRPLTEALPKRLNKIWQSDKIDPDNRIETYVNQMEKFLRQKGVNDFRYWDG